MTKQEFLEQMSSIRSEISSKYTIYKDAQEGFLQVHPNPSFEDSISFISLLAKIQAEKTRLVNLRDETFNTFIESSNVTIQYALAILALNVSKFQSILLLRKMFPKSSVKHCKSIIEGLMEVHRGKDQ